MSAPLDGIRVVDFSELLPGPFLSQSLVEMGAEVIKIERAPHGDPLRRSSPGLFAMVNRGKSSVMLNLKAEADRERAHALITGADVMIEGFRPDVMARLGLDPAALVEQHPSLIVLSLSGYGQTGPMRKVPGHDLNYLALAGVTALCGRPDGPPEHTFGLPVADLAGANYGLSALLAALFQRTRTDRGQWIDLSLTDCVAHWVNARRGPFSHRGIMQVAGQRFAALVRPAYGVFACADGAIAIAALEGHFWRGLQTALPLGQFGGAAYDDPAARQAEAIAINAAIGAAIAPMLRGEALEILTRHDVPASPVLGMAETETSPHFKARNLLVETGAGPTTPFPVRLAGMPPTPFRAPPLEATEGK